MEGKGRSWSVAVTGALLVSVFSIMMTAVPEGASAYTSSSPIYIQSNLDFDAGHGVLSGTGTQADPYIIDGWEIVTIGYGYGIIVANTDKYFTIRNCYIHGVSWDGSQAIYLTNVKHGAVQSCTLADIHRGIDLRASSYIAITSCDISDCGYGIYSETSNDISVTDCLIHNNAIGFSQQASGCRNCTFSSNNITGNSEGILAYPAYNFTIAGNNVSTNYGTGVYLGESDKCYVSDNFFEGNLGAGLALSRATNTTLTSNVFVDDGLGIWGENLTHWNSQVIGTDNLVNGLPLLYLKDNEAVVVDGEPIGALILANCTGTRVTNLTIDRTHISVCAGYSDYLLIENCTLTNEYIGVFLNLCSYAVVQNNVIINATLDPHRGQSVNPGYGINAYLCPGLQISGNNITHPDVGISLGSCPNATVEGNNITIGNYAMGIGGWQCDNALLLANEVSFKDGGISWGDSRNVTLTGNTVSNSVNDAMYLSGITDLVMVANYFVDNGFGIRLSQIVNTSLIGNYVLGTYCSYEPSFDMPCLQLQDSQSIELIGNIMSGNENGLYMYNCGSIDVVGNDFSLEENEGIYLEWCHGLSISLNNVSSNGVDGIHLRTCDGVQSVTDNLVYDNPVGMYFDQSAPEVIGNEIVANGAGMELLWASGVLVYHNDFIANTVHVSASNTMFSRWNDSYPSGGNYWDNYTGIDVKNGPLQDQNGSDGIGDTPMVFAPGLEDMYPLMAMNGTNRPPVALFTVEPNSGDVMSDFEFNASSSFDYGEDQSTLEVRWDWENDGTWDTAWSTTKTAVHQYSSNGAKTAKLAVRDTGGLESTTTKTLTVAEAPPVTTVTLGGTIGENNWYVTSVTLNLSATDDVSGVNETKYRLNGGAWHNYAGNFALSNDGTMLVEYYSTDFDGFAETVKSVTIKIDKTDPTLTIDQTFGFEATVDHVIISWTGSDATSGIDRFEVRIDGGTFTSVDKAISHNFTGLADGMHNVTVKAIDAAGNEVNQTIQFTVDTSGTGGGISGDLMFYGGIVAIIVFFVVIAMLSMMRRKKSSPMESEEMKAEPPGGLAAFLRRPL